VSSQVKNRSEIIFLYDVKDNNPNGDPLNENKPRIDEETSINYVTDVRLKRTIRDFIALTEKQKEPYKIFMLQERRTDNSIVDKTELVSRFASIEELVKECIDIRLFGGTFALSNKKKKNEDEEDTTENAKAITGPVQFRLGRSMHKVLSVENQLAVSVPHKKKDKTSQAGTFGYDQFLYYSLIKFYGVINENAANCTGLTEEDVQKLLKAIWFGTKELNTRTKIGHTPRLLIKVDYKSGFFIGDLDSKIKLETDLLDEQIRSPMDYKIDLSQLNKVLEQNKGNIVNIWMMASPDLEFTEELNVAGKTVTKLENQPWFNIYQMV
jgi:CRISPR-associated protein Csh2